MEKSLPIPTSDGQEGPLFEDDIGTEIQIMRKDEADRSKRRFPGEGSRKFRAHVLGEFDKSQEVQRG